MKIIYLFILTTGVANCSYGKTHFFHSLLFKPLINLIEFDTISEQINFTTFP